jgi:hypothetical protein
MNCLYLLSTSFNVLIILRKWLIFITNNLLSNLIQILINWIMLFWYWLSLLLFNLKSLIFFIWLLNQTCIQLRGVMLWNLLMEFIFLLINMWSFMFLLKSYCIILSINWLDIFTHTVISMNNFLWSCEIISCLTFNIGILIMYNILNDVENYILLLIE